LHRGCTEDCKDVCQAGCTSGYRDFCTADFTAGCTARNERPIPLANVCTEKIATPAEDLGAVAPARAVQTAVSLALQAAVEAAVQLALPAARLHFQQDSKDVRKIRRVRLSARRTAHHYTCRTPRGACNRETPNRAVWNPSWVRNIGHAGVPGSGMGFMKPELWYSQIIWWNPHPRGELAA